MAALTRRSAFGFGVSNAPLIPQLSIVPGLFVDPDTFYVHEIFTSLEPDLFTDPDTFYVASVSTGEVSLEPSIFINVNTFYVHSIKTGAILEPALFVDADTFYTASITGGASAASTTPDSRVYAVTD